MYPHTDTYNINGKLKLIWRRLKLNSRFNPLYSESIVYKNTSFSSDIKFSSSLLGQEPKVVKLNWKVF